MISFIFFFQILLQFFYYIGHLFFISTLFRLKLSDKTIDFIVFFFFQEVEFHFVAFALNLKIHIFILLKSQ